MCAEEYLNWLHVFSSFFSTKYFNKFDNIKNTNSKIVNGESFLLDFTAHDNYKIGKISVPKISRLISKIGAISFHQGSDGLLFC